MNAITPALACTSGGLPFPAALARVLGLVEAPLPAETVAAAASLGRVLAAPVCARLDLPGFDQSAMDGYAISSRTAMPGTPLPVIGRTAAGAPPGRLAEGGAHRILTGAPLPLGADAVVAQEQADRDGDLLRLPAVPPPGTNMRRRGEDVRAGAALVPAGTLLDWRHLTMLAAQGIGAVTVRRRPVVGLLSSGRELCAQGTMLAAGQIHDSNQPMLAALLAAWGADVRPLPVAADSQAAMQYALRLAARDSDLVLTTAGISVGDEDHVRDALHALGGDLAVLKVAMKPGKPLAAGRLGRAAFLGLPGNPQAALTGAVGFVRPLLAGMAGTPAPAPLHARAGFALRRKPGRTEFLPVRLAQREACLWAERTGPDGSGRLSPLLTATGLALLPEGAAELRQGTMLEVLPFGTAWGTAASG